MTNRTTTNKKKQLRAKTIVFKLSSLALHVRVHLVTNMIMFNHVTVVPMQLIVVTSQTVKTVILL